MSRRIRRYNGKKEELQGNRNGKKIKLVRNMERFEEDHGKDYSRNM